MILCIASVLSADELARIGASLNRATFEDGRATAGWSARLVKQNTQLVAGSEPHRQIVELALEALARNEVLQAAALPRTWRPPLVSRYEKGMSYGPHVDDAIMGPPPMRTDLSYTLFLNGPDQYAGGELMLEDAEGDRSYKLDAGSMVVYPSTTLHRVETVQSGVRTVVVGWIQSLCPDPRHREALFDLYRVRNAAFERGGKSEEFDLLSKTYSNLLRLFAVV
jgi:PKHD-type hydroxylase